MEKLYLDAARLEFHWLCQKIVHDGRDPFVVAEALFERLVKSNREYQTLWDAKEER